MTKIFELTDLELDAVSGGTISNNGAKGTIVLAQCENAVTNSGGKAFTGSLTQIKAASCITDGE